MSDLQRGIFGIDLGTTYSVVGYIDDTGRAAVTRNSHGYDTTPSVVYFENEGNVVVGNSAKEAASQYPNRSSRSSSGKWATGSTSGRSSASSTPPVDIGHHP